MGTIIHDPARNTISADSQSLRLNTTGGEALRLTASDDAVNILEIKSAAAGNKISVNAIGTDTDIDIDLIPKGAGVLKSGVISATVSYQMPIYNVGNVPANAIGKVVYVSNGDDGEPCLAVFDGNDWKRVVLGGGISEGV